MYRKSITSWTD